MHRARGKAAGKEAESCRIHPCAAYPEAVTAVTGHLLQPTHDAGGIVIRGGQCHKLEVEVGIYDRDHFAAGHAHGVTDRQVVAGEHNVAPVRAGGRQAVRIHVPAYDCRARTQSACQAIR